LVRILLLNQLPMTTEDLKFGSYKSIPLSLSLGEIRQSLSGFPRTANASPTNIKAAGLQGASNPFRFVRQRN
jgi:hypothetical protein